MLTYHLRLLANSVMTGSRRLKRVKIGKKFREINAFGVKRNNMLFSRNILQVRVNSSFFHTVWNVIPVVVAVEAAVVAVVTAVADSEEWAGVEVQSVAVKVASEFAVHAMLFELEHVVREQEPKIVNK